MIFPPDSLFEIRRSIVARVESGEISELDGYREALAADPEDPAPLLFLGVQALEAGDLPTAERYAREAIRHHPSGVDAYLFLAQVMETVRPRCALSRAYLVLGLQKIEFDQENLEQYNLEGLASAAGLRKKLRGKPVPVVLAALVEEYRRGVTPESAEEVEELRPHRLIHKLRECRDQLLEPATVDEILKNSAACEPLLMGILKEFGSQSLTDDDYRMVERALVLLGEIGSPRNLPAIAEFLALEYEDIAGPADWAFRRISFQHPAEALAVIRELLPSVGAPECVVLGQQITMTPEVPERGAVLSLLADQIERFGDGERRAVVFCAIAAYYLVEGASSFRAAQLEQKYAKVFSGEARVDLRALRAEAAVLQPEEASADELSVYDICCSEPDHEEHAPKPEPNDPCWCGSGKKYKKCHLTPDLRREVYGLTGIERDEPS